MHASINACQNAQNMHAACAAEWPDLRAWWYFGSTCTRHPTKLSRHFLCWGFAAETFPADRGLTVYFCLMRRACMTDLCNDKKEIARPFFLYLKFKLKKIHSTFTAMCNSHSDHESPLHPDETNSDLWCSWGVRAQMRSDYKKWFWQFNQGLNQSLLRRDGEDE